MARLRDAEESAARALQCLLGGTWEIHDTGERRGMFDVVHVLDDGLRIAHPRFSDRDAWALAALGVMDVIRWNTEPEPGAPKILVHTSWSVIGSHTSLPEAIERLFTRTDNQDKLELATQVDERHLYVHMRDHAASAGLRGIWPLPMCPPDPRGVIDVLWIWASPWGPPALIHRVVPGTDDWSHFVIDTGQSVPESSLEEWSRGS